MDLKMYKHYGSWEFFLKKEEWASGMFLLNCWVRIEALLGMGIDFCAFCLSKALPSIEYWIELLDFFLGGGRKVRFLLGFICSLIKDFHEKLNVNGWITQHSVWRGWYIFILQLTCPFTCCLPCWPVPSTSVLINSNNHRFETFVCSA